MQSIEYDEAAAECRIAAYIDFLMTAYGTDLHGLADVAGIPRQTLTKFTRAPYLQKSFFTLAKLAELTGVSLSWLAAENTAGITNGEGVA